MAIIRNNIIIEGLSGRVGGLVYKNYGSIIVVTSRPCSPKIQSAHQKANWSKFKKATRWAKSMMLDASMKEFYRNKALEFGLTNSYTAALTDYMRSPKNQ